METCLYTVYDQIENNVKDRGGYQSQDWPTFPYIIGLRVLCLHYHKLRGEKGLLIGDADAQPYPDTHCSRVQPIPENFWYVLVSVWNFSIGISRILYPGIGIGINQI